MEITNDTSKQSPILKSVSEIVLRGPYRWKIILFIICFHAIMHRTTIVQNKMINIICSCFSFCLVNIYSPGIGKLWLGRLTHQNFRGLIFILEEKKSLLRIVCTTMLHILILNFNLFLKNILKNRSKNLLTFLIKNI